MKQCPHCGSAIEENARFCLYCMTELEGKALANPKPAFWQQRRFKILLSCLVLLLAVTIPLLFFLRKPAALPGTPADEPAASQPEQEGEQTPEGNTVTEAEPGDTPTQTPGSDTNTNSNAPSLSLGIVENPADQKNPGTPSGGDTAAQKNPTTTPAPNNQGSTGQNNQGNTTGDNTPPQNTTGDKTPDPAPDKNEDQKDPEPEDNSVSQVTYYYRTAGVGDGYGNNTTAQENAVVITGVSAPAKNGVYIIPETIDGKKVIDIKEGAFCGEGIASTVKTVIVPATVSKICAGAFTKCYNLTDIYFCGEKIQSWGNAYPAYEERTGTFTIHCSATCNNVFYTYSYAAWDYFKAEYKKWDGSLDFLKG